MKLSLSIEGKEIRIIEAVKRSQGIFIQKTLNLSFEQLDSYLKTTKHKRFILTVDFKELLQETLALPPLKGKELKRLLSVETARLYPDFYYIYSDLGERIIENKRTRLISLLRTQKSEIDHLIDKFLSHGKEIEAIYAPVCSIASFIERSERPLLVVFETGGTITSLPEGGTVEKNIFLLKEGVILFTRKLTSFEKGLAESDIQGITFSITHCIQNLRIQPEEIILAGDFNSPPEYIGGIKVSVLKPPENLHFRGDNIYPYLIGAGAVHLYFSSDAKAKSLLPSQYESFKKIKTLLTASTVTFIVIGILFSGLGINNLLTARSMKTNIENLFIKYKAFTKFVQSYIETVQEAKALQPFVEFLKEEGIFSSQILKDLSAYNLDKIKLKTIELTRSESSMNVRLSGVITSPTHKEMFLYFNNLLKTLEGGKSNDTELIRRIVDKKFSVVDGSFELIIEYSLKRGRP